MKEAPPTRPGTPPSDRAGRLTADEDLTIVAAPAADVSWRRLLGLAAPVFAENLLLMAVAWSDTLLASWFIVKQDALAALGVVAYLVWLLKCLTDFIGSGAQAVISRLTGAGEHEEASRVAVQALWLAAVLGPLLAVATYHNADRAAGMMNLTGEARRLAGEYLRWQSLAVAPLTFGLVGTACFRAVGRPVIGLQAGLVENAVNLALAWTFVTGWVAEQRWGMTGLAIAMSSGYAAGGVMVALRLFTSRSGLRLTWAWPDLARMGRVLVVGIPGGMHAAGLVLCHLWFVSLIARLGTLAIGAHIVIIHMESLSYQPGEAVAVAVATLVGQSLGAGRPDLARLAVRRGLLLAALPMLSVGALFLTNAPALTRIVMPDPSQAEQAALAATGLRMTAISEPALAAMIIFGATLRGSGDTRWLFALGVGGILFVRVPLAWWLTTYTEWGVVGAWTAMVLDLHIRAALSAWCFRNGGWTRVVV